MVFFAHPGLWGLAWVPSWVGPSCQTQSENRNRGSAQLPGWPCPRLLSTLLAQQWGLKPFDPLLPEPLSSSIPQSAEPCSSSSPSCCPLCTVQPSPPPPSSSLLLPSYISSWNDFKTLLLPDSCLWLSSHRLLCLHIFTCDSVLFQSHGQAKWTDEGTEEPVTWLFSTPRFSLSLLLCLRLPLTVLLRFLTQMIN